MTPREYIEAAYATSSKNQPGEIATEATELLNLVIRIVRTVFTIGARVNPTYFGKTGTLTHNASTWPYPTDAESVWRLEIAGVQVLVVPFDDQALADGEPAVYRFGAVYREVEDSVGTGNLTAYYSRTPTDPADLDSEIDSAWPAQHDPVIIDALGLYLALKDGREEELPGHQSKLEQSLSRFVAFLEHETVGEVRRFESPRYEHSNTIVPLKSMLLGAAGG